MLGSLEAGDLRQAQAVEILRRERMARFKVPRSVVFGVLPKTSTGKIQKFLLRERVRSASAKSFVA